MPQDPNQTKRDVVLDVGAGSPPAGGRSWFFGIGINKYTHFPTLNNAVKDVQDLLTLLRERYDILPECIRTLFDEEATHQNIIGAFDQLQREVGEADKLIIYYSGHGHLDKEINKGYWIPTDAGRENTAHYVRNSTVREYIEVIRALHTLLISDSCFSGSLFVRGTSRSAAAISELESLPSRWAICSGRHNEEVFDGEPGSNSPFAESILDTLRRNAKKEFNVAKLVDRVVEQTRANYQQLPEGNPLYGVGHKGGQYIFRLRADEAEDWAAAQAAGTLPAFEQFLENHPAGAHAGEARGTIAFLEEEAAWEKAKAAHTVLSYFEYDRAYPHGRYNHQALEAIAELEEEAAWQEAQRLDKLSAYRKYTSDYPQGKYRAEADARMEALVAGQQEPALWQQALGQDTVAAYEAYLKQYPRGTYAVEARSRLVDLQQAAAEKERTARQQQEEAQKRRQEEEAWEAAQATGTEEAYRQFLLRYPRGAFAAEAKTAIDQAKAAKEAPPPVQSREEKTPPVAVARPQPSPARTQIHKKPLPRWLPMAAGGVVLILLIGWGIGKISGGSSGVPAKPVLEVFEENGKFGYRNGQGDIIIPARFDAVRPFLEGKAQVTLDGQTFTIDETGACLADCPEEKDKAAWAEAERLNNLDAYKTYQQNFPKGQFYEEAQKRINQFEADLQKNEAALRDQQAWEAAAKKDGIAAYESYQRAYPNGQYYQQAQKRIDALRDQQAWEAAAKKNNIAAYESYQRSYPNGQYYQQAQKRIDAIREPLGYPTKTFNGLRWITKNLNVEVADSWCYDNNPANCDKYGRLYTWEAAKNACKVLGNGWHLPTDEEWKRLANAQGGYYDRNTSKGFGDPKKAYTALFENGSSGFSALLGGWRYTDGSFSHLGVGGNYWSASEYGAGRAWDYFFYRLSGQLDRDGNDKAIGFSCRCALGEPSNGND